jgi:hypothetical protein
VQSGIARIQAALDMVNEVKSELEKREKTELFELEQLTHFYETAIATAEMQVEMLGAYSRNYYWLAENICRWVVSFFISELVAACLGER